ncbi:hypothetical protein MORE_10390 [Moorella thermoacetica]|nr:hypothetical protein MORE_10390 [Moorella thermoacetica]
MAFSFLVPLLPCTLTFPLEWRTRVDFHGTLASGKAKRAAEQPGFITVKAKADFLKAIGKNLGLEYFYLFIVRGRILTFFSEYQI